MSQKSKNQLTTRRNFLSLSLAAVSSIILSGWSYAKRHWPVRTVEKSIPVFDPQIWRLTIDGLVDEPLKLNYQQIKQLPSIVQVKNLDCVERWCVKKLEWKGVQLHTLIDLVKPKQDAQFLTFHCAGGVYSESLTLEQALKPDVMLAYEVDDQMLPFQHGAPLRLVVPGMWAYKSAKWVERIEFVKTRHPGYWEQRGYKADAEHGFK